MYINFTSLEFFPQKEREREGKREVYWVFVALCPRGFSPRVKHGRHLQNTHILAQVGVIMRRLGLTLV